MQHDLVAILRHFVHRRAALDDYIDPTDIGALARQTDEEAGAEHQLLFVLRGQARGSEHLPDRRVATGLMCGQ
ncbi:hypothetical protein [Aquimonas sp.]|uniref:hypothetical protein n=1 Tax=Aquimonas sp. TaxID=1872588 RepID=UPI0037BEBFDF